MAMELEDKMGCCVINEYGAFDIGNFCQSSVDDPPQVRLLTVGKPHPGLELRLVDEAGQDVAKGEAGEIIVRGPTCQGGYFLDPEATWAAWTRDGWGRTGDQGKWDEQGNLVIIGRTKDMIIRGGQNIYPQEVESLLVQHPKVLSAAIVGMPDPEMGERCCAYVVAKPGGEFTFEAMVAFLKEKQVASYKIPERLEVVESLPIVADQKVDKKALHQDIVQKIEQEKRHS
jgi:non-ribosomal peptide synthetase component E (peptide arylation enzyme)